MREYSLKRMALALLLAALGLVGPAMAAERIALVMGNSAYRHAPRLANPTNDAKAVAEALTGLGFTVTGPLYDLGKAQMDAALLAFGRRAQAAEAAVVFFAGHGLEARGRNYLIPVDATLERDSSASLEAVALEVVLDQIAGPSGYRLVILDACRDNPLANRMQRSDGTRAVYRGLGRVELEGQTYVAYAAKDGTRARDDGGGGHSPFTAALLKYLKEPLALPNLFGAVREDVLAATQRQQEPWLYGAFGREPVYLTPPPTQSSQLTPPLPPPLPPPAPVARPSEPTPVALAPSAPSAGRVFQDKLKDGSAGPAMVVIPAGEFWMGSPENEVGRDRDEGRHPVSIAAFAMGRTEVTFAEYDRFCESTGRSKPGDQGWGRDRRPVIDVSWRDAMAYADWLSQQTGRQYRLPAEAEWEYAARAGTATAYWWGDEIGSGRANCNSCGAAYEFRTAPAGSFPANPWQLYDTVGNVDEWTCSSYTEKYAGGETTCADETMTGARSVRGGSWYALPGWARSAARFKDDPANRAPNLGFRLARSMEPNESLEAVNLDKPIQPPESGPKTPPASLPVTSPQPAEAGAPAPIMVMPVENPAPGRDNSKFGPTPPASSFGVKSSPNRQELQNVMEQMMVSPGGSARPVSPPSKPRPPMVSKPSVSPKPAPPMEVSKPTQPKVVSPPRFKPPGVEPKPNSQPYQPPPVLY